MKIVGRQEQEYINLSQNRTVTAVGQRLESKTTIDKEESRKSRLFSKRQKKTAVTGEGSLVRGNGCFDKLTEPRRWKAQHRQCIKMCRQKVSEIFSRSQETQSWEGYSLQIFSLQKLSLLVSEEHDFSSIVHGDSNPGAGRCQEGDERASGYDNAKHPGLGF